MIVSNIISKSFFSILTFSLSFLLILSCKSSTVNAKTDIDSKKFTLNDVSYTKKSIYVGEINKEQLKLFKAYLQENFNQNLDIPKFISVSYLKPRCKCWYDNYNSINTTKFANSFSKSRSKMNSKLILLHSEKNVSSSVSYFDKDQFVYKLFDKGIEVCDFSLTIDNRGNFLFKAGHFDLKVLNAFKNELETFNITNSN